MDFLADPAAIEERSMEIIDQLLGPHDFTPQELTVVKRIVHAGGDPACASLVAFSPGALEEGLAALQNQAAIYTDVKMVQAGINSTALASLGGQVHCAVSDPQVRKLAADQGRTRAMTAFRLWGQRLNGNIVVIGNAPTALFETLRLAQEENIHPALVVGMPVGFVGAAESKAALKNSDLAYVTISGTRGGSTLAVAAINALIYLAGGIRRS